ncbi:MAG: type II toxin-antitoxin system VapC family toxin [Thaumarchaeota archaeon]|nr:type II toxin-antitoxin system VapC family toxin [Nitrososphaerota archaeon]
MKSRFVIDTGVLTLFYAGEARVRPYFDRINDNKAEGLMMSVNLSEHFYKTCQKLGRQTANLRYYQSRTILTIVETSEELALAAGTEKCRRSALSLADCFALALARSVKGTLLTTDGELGKVKDIDVKLFRVDL